VIPNVHRFQSDNDAHQLQSTVICATFKGK